ncbi:3-hydroxybutyrate dehydrogenase [Kibdelosporangium phytohabitans]|uniref:3-hydroxybutyrate dehydrogenase n=1 Tax=Kibdelosporangium phytohabitans TaxID=860235 RepID=A0A0N9IGP5_9PSEU|nr:3-hydroxybutyrate dehydrogenase [Kibdelosporangium phytohabitans]ALG14054.1 3-hydroxybutyrate dehydrogenase [Kibdelosporangium phytohabitans]MBE1466979.1 3-hydroxybutyrate dehydrogenase [Kibdelosporangium phytohabitans]
MSSGVPHTGRVALVTGGAHGIGLACVRALANCGARVHVADLDGDEARAVAHEVGGVAHEVDLADGVDGLPADVDILVNNAGSQHVAPIHEFPPPMFARLQQVMVTAPFLLIRQVLPHMYSQGWGRIVNISSAHGLRASAFKSGYVAAKHALEGLSKVAALEGAPHGVTSNCVNPGYVRTRLVEDQIAAQAQAHGISTGEVVERIMLDRSAVKRLIEPDDVADVVLWLCGPHSGHVTGTSIAMDGGWTAS